MLNDDSYKGEKYNLVTLTGAYTQVNETRFIKKNGKRILKKRRLYEGVCDCGVKKYFNISSLPSKPF